MYHKYQQYYKVQTSITRPKFKDYKVQTDIRNQIQSSGSMGWNISAKGSSTEKSYIGSIESLPNIVSYELPKWKSASAEPFPFRCRCLRWSVNHPLWRTKYSANLITLSTLAFWTKKLVNWISGLVPRYSFKVISVRWNSRHSMWLLYCATFSTPSPACICKRRQHISA